MRKNLLLVFVLIAGMGHFAFSQSRVPYADQQMELLNYRHAIEVYEEAYEKKPSYETAKKLGEAYGIIREYQASQEWWEKAISFEEATSDDQLMYLKSAQNAGEIEEGKALLTSKGVNIDAFAGSLEPSYVSLETNKRLKINAVQELNTEAADFIAAEGNDGLIYFVSDRGEVFPDEVPALRVDGRNQIFDEDKNGITGRMYYSVYSYDKDEDEIKKVTGDFEGVKNFSDPYFAKEAGVLFFSVTRDIQKVKKNREFVVQPEIYYSKLDESGELTGFYPFPYNDSIAYAVMHPFVDEEAGRLYFASDMPGGQGGLDLYYSVFDGDMNFSPPINLGSGVNTSESEAYPFIKNQKLYFSSRGYERAGGLDLFMAEKSGDLFDNVQNMGQPFNSEGDDFGYRHFEDGRMFISSNREGGMGEDDLYVIQNAYKTLLARVIDCDNQVMPGNFEASVVSKATGEKLSFENTEKGLVSDLEPDSDYLVSVSKRGYFVNANNSVTTKGFDGDTLEVQYRLTAIPYQMPIVVEPIYYDLDKSFIREDAKPHLDRIGKLMNKYGFLKLLVASYTDSRANDAYNLALSNRRADAVLDYLEQYNIPRDQVRLEWFGEENLLNDCGDGVPCPEDQHQLNRRSELILEVFPDPSKQYEIPAELKGKDFCTQEEIQKIFLEKLKAEGDM